MAEIQVTIQGRTVSVPEGSTVLDAARKAGFEIPTLCHDEKLKPYAGCFICVCKIEGGRGNLVPSCATVATDGMTVTVEDDEIFEARRTALNLILSDHLGDCTPPCQASCPAGIDIRGFLAHIAKSDEVAATKLIRQAVPTPGILGRICPRPCQTACRRGCVDDSLNICNLKRHAADEELKQKGRVELPEIAPETGKHIGVVGAGPAGMSAAFYLRLQGHKVTVYEAKSKTGGMLRYGIPFFRLPEKVLDQEFGLIEEMGVDIKLNIRIGRDITCRELEENHDAVLLTIGAWKGMSMRVEGENEAGVMTGIEYLDQVVEGNPPNLGKKVAVVGGGNTAMDVCRTARRFGTEVDLLYRRTEKEMPAEDLEIEEAKHEGTVMRFLTAPVKAEKAEDGGVYLTCVKMELGEPDASGRRRPVPVEGSEERLHYSSAISAVGQSVVTSDFKELGLEETRWGTFKVHPVTFQCSNKKFFAAGDCETGADIAVRAFGNARRASVSIDQFVKGQKVVGEPVPFNSSMDNLGPPDMALFEGVERKAANKMPAIPADKRISCFDEVETGFVTEEARLEAARCLRCGCSAVDDCKLRIYSTLYGADQKKYPGQHRGLYLDESHKDIRIEAHKCISCGACVRACKEVRGLNVLAFVNRGFITRMLPPLNKLLAETECDGCGECSNVCPTAGIRTIVRE